MTGSNGRNLESNHGMLIIRPSEWISSNEYKNCTLIKVTEEEYKFLYGTLRNHSAWVQIELENQSWVYYPFGNKSFKSKSYAWLGDLLDDAVEHMIGSKL